MPSSEKQYKSDLLMNPLIQQRIFSERPTAKDFETVAVVGQGAYGMVRVVRYRVSGDIFALKQMAKVDLTLKSRESLILQEIIVLYKANSPWIPKLYYAWQDFYFLYLLMEFTSGGDLMKHLTDQQRFSESTCRFYIAELILSLAYVHDTLQCAHRDIKPENILLDSKGHVKLADFGLSKFVGNYSCEYYASKKIKNKKKFSCEQINLPHKHTIHGPSLLKSGHSKIILDKIIPRQHKPHSNKNPRGLKERTKVVFHERLLTGAGTTDYMAPEIHRQGMRRNYRQTRHHAFNRYFKENGYNRTVDWWSVGVVLFDMLFGTLPFTDRQRIGYMTMNRIIHWKKHFTTLPPECPISQQCEDFLRRLLAEPEDRIQTAAEAAQHPWLQTINWDKIREQTPPLCLNMTVLGLHNFDLVDLRKFLRWESRKKIEANQAVQLIKIQIPDPPSILSHPLEKIPSILPLSFKLTQHSPLPNIPPIKLDRLKRSNHVLEPKINNHDVKSNLKTCIYDKPKYPFMYTTKYPPPLTDRKQSMMFPKTDRYTNLLHDPISTPRFSISTTPNQVQHNTQSSTRVLPEPAVETPRELNYSNIKNLSIKNNYRHQKHLGPFTERGTTDHSDMIGLLHHPYIECHHDIPNSLTHRQLRQCRIQDCPPIKVQQTSEKTQIPIYPLNHLHYTPRAAGSTKMYAVNEATYKQYENIWDLCNTPLCQGNPPIQHSSLTQQYPTHPDHMIVTIEHDESVPSIIQKTSCVMKQHPYNDNKQKKQHKCTNMLTPTQCNAEHPAQQHKEHLQSHVFSHKHTQEEDTINTDHMPLKQSTCVFNLRLETEDTVPSLSDEWILEDKEFPKKRHSMLKKTNTFQHKESCINNNHTRHQKVSNSNNTTITNRSNGSSYQFFSVDSNKDQSYNIINDTVPLLYYNSSNISELTDDPIIYSPFIKQFKLLKSQHLSHESESYNTTRTQCQLPPIHTTHYCPQQQQRTYDHHVKHDIPLKDTEWTKKKKANNKCHYKRKLNQQYELLNDTSTIIDSQHCSTLKSSVSLHNTNISSRLYGVTTRERIQHSKNYEIPVCVTTVGTHHICKGLSRVFAFLNPSSIFKPSPHIK